MVVHMLRWASSPKAPLGSPALKCWIYESSWIYDNLWGTNIWHDRRSFYWSLMVNTLHIFAAWRHVLTRKEVAGIVATDGSQGSGLPLSLPVPYRDDPNGPVTGHRKWRGTSDIATNINAMQWLNYVELQQRQYRVFRVTICPVVAHWIRFSWVVSPCFTPSQKSPTRKDSR